MNLRSLSIINSFHQEDHQFAVIGLGRFGRAVCNGLKELGYEVLGTDLDDKLVHQVILEKSVSHAIKLDSTDPVALKEAGIFEFDTVIIAIGNYVEESIITTLNVKEGGVKHVIAKASSEIHRTLLEKVGATQVVFPEKEAGLELAQKLTKPGILERFELDPEHSIVEVLIPEEFHGKTIAQLQLRNCYGLNLLAVGQGEHFEINPKPTQVLSQGLAMVVIGSNKDIKRLPI